MTETRTRIVPLALGRGAACAPRPDRSVRQSPRLLMRERGAQPQSLALLQDLCVFEFAADRACRLHHLEAGPDIHGGAAVLVEAPLAIEAVEVLGGCDGVEVLLAVLYARPLDAFARHLCGFPGFK